MPRERKQVGLRLPDEIAAKVSEAARAADVSINRWITGAVTQVLEVGAELADWENEKARLATQRRNASLDRDQTAKVTDRRAKADAANRPPQVRPAKGNEVKTRFKGYK